MSVSLVREDQVAVAPVLNLANAKLASYHSVLGNLARVLKNVNCTVLSKRITDLFISPANATGQVDLVTAEVASRLCQKFLQLQRVYLTQAISYLSPKTSKIALEIGQIIPTTSDENVKSALRVLGIPTYEHRFKHQIINNLVDALSHPTKRSTVTVEQPTSSKSLANLRTHLLVLVTLEFRDAVIELAHQELSKFTK